jgi:hypothetical protein
MSEEVIGYREVMRRMHLGKDVVYRLFDKGELTGYILKGEKRTHRLFYASGVKAYMERNRNPVRSEPTKAAKARRNGRKAAAPPSSLTFRHL